MTLIHKQGVSVVQPHTRGTFSYTARRFLEGIVCVYAAIPFILDASLYLAEYLHAPAGFAQEECLFFVFSFPNLPSAVDVLICISRRVQFFLSLVDFRRNCILE